MSYTSIIGVGLVIMSLIFTGAVYGGDMSTAAIDEQKVIAKSYVEIKCDPCDYNIDYGDTNNPVEKGGVDEGTVKLECDPCDYNIDYGEKYQPIKK